MTQLRSMLLHPSFLTGLRDGFLLALAAGSAFILGLYTGLSGWYPA